MLQALICPNCATERKMILSGQVIWALKPSNILQLVARNSSKAKRQALTNLNDKIVLACAKEKALDTMRLRLHWRSGVLYAYSIGR